MGYEFDKENDILLIRLSDEKPDFEDQSGPIITHYSKSGKHRKGFPTLMSEFRMKFHISMEFMKRIPVDTQQVCFVKPIEIEILDASETALSIIKPILSKKRKVHA